MSVLPMTEILDLRFTLDSECPIDDYLEDGLITEYFTTNEGDYQVIFKDVDEVLIESLRTEELAEFFGLDSEFVTYLEILDV